MYKILNRDTNEHVIFKTDEEACLFKRLDPKKAFRYRRRTADRPKDFISGALLHFAAENDIKGYVKAWLTLNKLAA